MKKIKLIKRVAAVLLVALIACALALPSAAATARQTVLIGGMPFGVKYTTEGILVVGYCDVACGGSVQNPARAAGLCPGDCILRINDVTPGSAAELSDLVGACEGEVTLCYRRNGAEATATLKPVACDSDGRARVGLFVRDGGAGIGTVTFMLPEQKAFAGLGHGICDGESGELIPLLRGRVMDVRIESVRRGAAGAPGELRGRFAGERGTLTQNTLCGVFGMMEELPASPVGRLPVATRGEVREGKASIWCTLEDGVPQEYTVTLSRIHRGAEGNKCFTVKVTDERLLSRTGGIVQGMSGSPIIQSGRLVGAVTHVLIGDPTTGYGIFIENMLANIPALLTR